MVRYEIVNHTTGQSVTAHARMHDGFGERARGLMFKRNLDERSAYIFPYYDIGRRGVHMLFVFEPLDVVWIARGRVERKETLRPFVGHASAPARHVIEFPEGGADGIRPGDHLGWGPVR